MEESKTLEDKKMQCLNFAKFGSLLGILTPLILFGGYEFLINGDIIKLEWFPYLFVILIGLAFMPLIAYVLYDKFVEYEGFTDIALRSVGVLTLLLIGVIIYFTGGYSNSIFTFYLFFIPAAVAISFDTKGSLYLIIPISFLVSLTNYLFSYKTDFDYGCTSYKGLFLTTLAFHFISILILELKKK